MDDFAAALDAALKRLRIRERFEGELREFLAKKDYDGETVDAVIQHLKAKGILSDARALAFQISKRGGKKAVGDERLRAELAAVGADSAVVDEGLRGMADEAERAHEALAARRGLTPEKAARFLAGRGFSKDAIESVLQSLGLEIGQG